MKKSFVRASRPAEYWEECYPIGNGNIGVMEDCGVTVDTLYLNDDRLWSGTGRAKQKHSDGGFDRAREKMLKNNFQQAAKLTHDELLSDWTEGYVPLGTLQIESRNRQFTSYLRTLDMKEGALEYSFETGEGGNKIASESFASYPDRVFIKRLTATEKTNSLFRLSSPLQSAVTVTEDGLLVTGVAPTYCAPVYHSESNPVVYDAANSGLRFAGLVSVKTDGKLTFDKANGTMSAMGYTYFELYLITEVANAIGKDVDLAAMKTRMEALLAKGFDEIREGHKADYQELFNRAELVINGKESSPLDTEAAMRKFSAGDGSDEVVATLFDFGRYLTISASREGTTAMNLQGIWNKEVRAPWSSNYTININTEMNYWPTLKANLAECYSPFIELVEKIKVAGELVAKDTFGRGGWTAAHNSDVWGHASPVGGSAGVGSVIFGSFLGGGGWLTNEWAEACRYSQDKNWIARLVPVITGAVKFYLELLTMVDGAYVTGLSTSPENRYFVGLFKTQVVDLSSAMDMAIIRQLFKNYVWISEQVEMDAEILEKVKAMLPKIWGYHFDKTGRVIEWHTNHREVDPHHRHISHLYGAFPGRELIEDGVPELYRGVEKTLKRRGMGGTGWALSWKLNVYARLGKGEACYELLKNQLHVVAAGFGIVMGGGGSYNSLLCAHPPFQIDGNFGALSGIIEMLLRSVDGVELAPAIPAAWHTLKVRGLVAEGGKVINYDYANGTAVLR